MLHDFSALFLDCVSHFIDVLSWIALGGTALFKKNEYFVWMNILDFYKMNNVLNKYFGLSLPASKMVVAKCLKLIFNHSGIISGTYFIPFQGVYYLYRGLRRASKPYFGILNNFPHFLWMNNFIEYSGLYWMNIFLNKYSRFCF